MRVKNRVADEDGQAIIVVAVAMSLFLIGAVGLVVDGSHLYAQRTMAQSAADAAALSGIMSIFDGTAGASGTGFPTGTSFTCTTTDARTPCVYASKNGFGGSSADTVTIDYPADTAAPGVAFSADATHLIRVTISRNVGTTLMHFMGPAASTIKAQAMAAIVQVAAPVPILVTHPTLNGSFSTNGGVMVKICGGPNRSVEVNSNSPTAVTTAGSGKVDLSKAGPLDPGDCSSGTGADFGTWGGPGAPPFIFLGGSAGSYIQPASPIADPLAGVAAPTPPVNSGTMGTHVALANGVNGCPASTLKPCQLYYPGLYPAPGINGDNSTVIFSPGIYYVQNGGVTCQNNCSMYMATGVPADGASGTNTGWTNNIMIYNTGTGQFNLGANGNIILNGSPQSSSYKGILFFEDHAAAANTSQQHPKNPHSLGGGGTLNLKGVIYLTNNKSTMTSTPSQYQELDLQGTSGSTTLIQGEIIVGALSLGGNSTINMDLNSSSYLLVRQVALVN